MCWCFWGISRAKAAGCWLAVVPRSGESLYDWIGLVGKIHRKPSIFPLKMGLSDFDFPLNQSIDCKFPNFQTQDWVCIRYLWLTRVVKKFVVHRRTMYWHPLTYDPVWENERARDSHTCFSVNARWNTNYSFITMKTNSEIMNHFLWRFNPASTPTIVG